MKLIRRLSFSQMLIFSLIASFTFSCVPMRKYEDLELRNGTLKQEFQSLDEQFKALEERNKALRGDLQQAQKELAETRKNLAEEKDRYERLDKTNRDLLERYDRMLAQNQAMLESSSDEKKELIAELNAKQLELDKRERSLRQLEEDLGKTKKDLTEREQKVEELQAAINEKDSKLEALRTRINEALLGLSAADLNVREENGKVYVSLSQNLLFQSGSKSINSAGKSALSKLARVLKDNPDIDITVEGHTDSDGDADYNWDLSVGRATSVVKELTDSGVDPKRIIASGRGEFFPIASNSTASGKAQNRRTEIILTPKLDALYQILNK